MKKLTRFLSYILVAAAASAATFGVMSSAQAGEDQGTYKLQELSALIQERFVGEVDVTAMEDAAADAMVEALGDEWSYYMSAVQYESYVQQMANAYVGIGVTVTHREDGYLDVVDVTAGGPAEAAGVLAGDVITHADGTDLSQGTLDDATSLIKGEEGTDVTITLIRGEQTMDYTITRAYFETVVAWGQMTEEGIGLVTIENFDSRCADETIAAIEELLAQGATALIFDVRNNPGGYVTELVEVLDYLLPEGVLFRSEYYNGATSTEESDESCLQIPMAVLVNSESYSAAEFFGAAMAEYDAAVIVGEQTYGKGYFQQAFLLSDGSAVGLSVGKYYTPNGENLAGVGITPDIQVDLEEELFLQIYYGNVDWSEDPQILAAIEALKSAD